MDYLLRLRSFLKQTRRKVLRNKDEEKRRSQINKVFAALFRNKKQEKTFRMIKKEAGKKKRKNQPTNHPSISQRKRMKDRGKTMANQLGYPQNIMDENERTDDWIERTYDVRSYLHHQSGLKNSVVAIILLLSLQASKMHSCCYGWVRMLALWDVAPSNITFHAMQKSNDWTTIEADCIISLPLKKLNKSGDGCSQVTIISLSWKEARINQWWRRDGINCGKVQMDLGLIHWRFKEGELLQ